MTVQTPVLPHESAFRRFAVTHRFALGLAACTAAVAGFVLLGVCAVIGARVKRS